METSQRHASNVQNIFSKIAQLYDGLNTIFSLGQDAVWRKKLVEIAVEGLGENSPPILDLAAGTLKVSKEIIKQRPRTPLLAVDFCLPMLQKGVPSLKNFSDNTLLPIVGNSLELPLADNCVSAITVAFGLRNFVPRDVALREMYRVLVPGGKLCILEFGSARNRILFGIYNWYLAHILPLIGRIVSKDKQAYQYLAETIAAFPSSKELVTEIEKEGFHEVRYRPLTAGIVCLHTGLKPKDAVSG